MRFNLQLPCPSLQYPRILLRQFNQNHFPSISDWVPQPSLSPTWCLITPTTFSNHTVEWCSNNPLLPWCFLLVIFHPLTSHFLLGYKFLLALAIFGVEPNLSPTLKPHCRGPYIYSVVFNKIYFTIFRNRLTDVEKRPVLATGEGGGSDDWVTDVQQKLAQRCKSTLL